MLEGVAKPDVDADPSESCPPRAIRSDPSGGDGKGGRQVARGMLPPPGPGQVRSPMEREA